MEKIRDPNETTFQRAWALNSMYFKAIQNRFSKAILESLSPDFDCISAENYMDFSKYYLLSKHFRGILVLGEPPQPLNWSLKSPEYNLRATKEINLEVVVSNVNSYIKENWKFPVEGGGPAK